MAPNSSARLLHIRLSWLLAADGFDNLRLASRLLSRPSSIFADFAGLVLYHGNPMI